MKNSNVPLYFIATLKSTNRTLFMRSVFKLCKKRHTLVNATEGPSCSIFLNSSSLYTSSGYPRSFRESKISDSIETAIWKISLLFLFDSTDKTVSKQKLSPTTIRPAWVNLYNKYSKILDHFKLISSSLLLSKIYLYNWFLTN